MVAQGGGESCITMLLLCLQSITFLTPHDHFNLGIHLQICILQMQIHTKELNCSSENFVEKFLQSVAKMSNTSAEDASLRGDDISMTHDLLPKITIIRTFDSAHWVSGHFSMSTECCIQI